MLHDSQVHGVQLVYMHEVHAFLEDPQLSTQFRVASTAADVMPLIEVFLVVNQA